jgi:hypothetical protein
MAFPCANWVYPLAADLCCLPGSAAHAAWCQSAERPTTCLRRPATSQAQQAQATSSQLAGVVFRGCLLGWAPGGFLGGTCGFPPSPWVVGTLGIRPSHLPPKCPWQNFPQQPRKPGHQTAGGGRGPGVRASPPAAPCAVYWHPGRSTSGWFGRGVACGPPAPVAARPLILDLRLCTSEIRD